MKKIQAVTAILSAVCPAAFAQDGRDPLLTRPGLEVGVQAAHYHYEEPNVAKLIGLRAGGVGAFTFMQGDAFFKADGRVSLGDLKYQGSGTQNSVPDYIFEVRLVAGTDLQAGEGRNLRRISALLELSLCAGRIDLANGTQRRMGIGSYPRVRRLFTR